MSDYYCSNYPYLDYVVTNCVDKELQIPYFSRHSLEDAIVYVSGSPRFLNSEGYLFSGTAKIDSKLIWGEDDLNSGVNVESVIGSIGNFTFLKIDKISQSITVFSDFFGSCPIYYYAEKDTVIISNRYHLLIHTLKELGVACTLNYKMVEYYCSMSDIFTNQLISEDTLVHGIKVLPAESVLTLDSGHIRLDKSPFGKIIESKTELSDKDYEDMVTKAADEIKENVRICFDNPLFSEYIIDLSGEIDTRLVLAALSNFPELMNKCKVFTFGGGEDLNCSSQLAEYYRIDYSSVYPLIHGINRNNYEITATQKPSDYIKMRQSCVLGTDFEPNDGLTDSNVRLKNVIRLTGGYGELGTRPYVSKLLDSMTRTADLGKIKKCLEKSNLVLLKRYPIEDAAEIIDTVISSSKYCSKIMKNESILSSRSRYHFNAQWTNSFRTPQWQPAQSICALKALIGTIDLTNNRKFVFDLLIKLSSNSLRLPFASVADNRDKIYFYPKTETVLRNTSPSFIYLLSKELAKTVFLESNSKSNFAEDWNNFDILDYLRKENIKLCDEILKSDTHLKNIIDDMISIITESFENQKTALVKMHAIYRRLFSIYAVLSDESTVFKKYEVPQISANVASEMDELQKLIDSGKSAIDSEYELGLKYHSGKELPKSEVLSRYWLQKASLSKRKYIVTDYALALINGTESDRELAKRLVVNYIKDDDSQSIRICGLALLKENNTTSEIIGLQLLKRASELGNKWAEQDIEKFCPKK